MYPCPTILELRFSVEWKILLVVFHVIGDSCLALNFFHILSPDNGDCLKYSIEKLIVGMGIGKSEHRCWIILPWRLLNRQEWYSVSTHLYIWFGFGYGWECYMQACACKWLPCCIIIRLLCSSSSNSLFGIKVENFTFQMLQKTFWNCCLPI